MYVFMYVRMYFFNFIYGLLLAPLLLYNSTTTSILLTKENLVITLSVAIGYPQHVCMYVRTYVCIYVCIYVCMYVCRYVCIFLIPLFHSMFHYISNTTC